jgi:hypothetical protein
MARPSRNASPEQVRSASRRFFVSSRTDAGRSLLQSERNAILFIEVLREYVKKKKFEVVDLVVMPNQVSGKEEDQGLKPGFSRHLRHG